MDEVVVSVADEQHWLRRAVDQNGFVLDVLVQRHAAARPGFRAQTAPHLRSAEQPPKLPIRVVTIRPAAP
jgi:putative transposase